LLYFCDERSPTKIYTLSLHDALPILRHEAQRDRLVLGLHAGAWAPLRNSGFCTIRPETSSIRSESSRLASSIPPDSSATKTGARSEEHTSELQSRENLVCRLLLEKKK